MEDNIVVIVVVTIIGLSCLGIAFMAISYHDSIPKPNPDDICAYVKMQSYERDELLPLYRNDDGSCPKIITDG